MGVCQIDSLFETVIDQSKNISQIEHSRHRSPTNAMVNLVAGIVSYQLRPRKPSITLALQGNAL